jgi:hypothetical protein
MACGHQRDITRSTRNFPRLIIIICVGKLCGVECELRIMCCARRARSSGAAGAVHAFLRAIWLFEKRVVFIE